MNAVLRLLHARTRAGCATMPHMTSMIRHLPGTTAVVLDSPHSGTSYPDDFGYACDFLKLRRCEDTHVEKLYAFAPKLGVGWLEAQFPRSYLDVNRDTTEVDVGLLDGPWTGPVATDPKVMSKIALGKGLVWRCLDDGEPIYKRVLTVAEVQARIACCWLPYHGALDEAIAAAQARHGHVIHINCHSMPAIAGSHATEFPAMAHADFVVGDRDGSTANPILSRLIVAHLRDLGYSVDYNHPYKGVELVRRHSDPAHQRHSIQLEINRKLYMDEETLAITSGFAPLQQHLRDLVERLLRTDPRALAM